MEPSIDTKAGIGDLLERVLDRGVILRLDLIISVAGIPLVGLSLQAALASIETMNAYGMFGDWDTASRKAAAAEPPARAELEAGESVVLEQFALLRCETGIMRIWRPGRAFLTDRRLVFVRRSPYEVLVSLALHDIAGIGSFVQTEARVTREVVCLAGTDGNLVHLRAAEAQMFQACLRDQLQRNGVDVTELDPDEVRDVGPDVRAESPLWHDIDSAGTWRPGWGALSGTSFTFWSDFERRTVVEVPLASLARVAVERRQLSATLGVRDVLCLVSGDDDDELCFIGKEVADWFDAIQRARTDRSSGNDS